MGTLGTNVGQNARSWSDPAVCTKRKGVEPAILSILPNNSYYRGQCRLLVN